MPWTAACESSSVTPGEITSGIPSELPANGPLIVFVRPPIELSFERVDGAGAGPLEHTLIGSITAPEPAFLVDVGEVSVGDVITIVPR